MCNVGAVGLGMQAVGTVGSYISSNKEAAAYSKYQTLQTQAALNNYIQQSKSINNRYAEEQSASSMEQQEIALENMRAKATAQASAASSGVEGSSIEMLFRGYDRATAVSNYTAARNLQMKGLQYTNELDGLRIQAINAINGMEQHSGASASTLLGGIGGLLTSYSRDYKGKSSGNSFSFLNRNTGKRTYGIRIDSRYVAGGVA